MKTVLLLSDIRSNSMDLSTSPVILHVSCKKLLKDLVVEKMSKNSSSLTRFILLIFLLGTLSLTLCVAW